MPYCWTLQSTHRQMILDQAESGLSNHGLLCASELLQWLNTKSAKAKLTAVRSKKNFRR